ncbi:DD3-3 [Symbiodinium sp. KB8]|nr:DD3-3 [Symbiodinium sp. KB8]
MQKHTLHFLMREPRQRADFWPPRISITWRWIVNHKRDCPLRRMLLIVWCLLRLRLQALVALLRSLQFCLDHLCRRSSQTAFAMAVLALAVMLSFGHLVQGDMYLNSPRGSNNKLREQSNNVQNANRLFDSQNNAASGYQIGDDCKPACKDENNNYDVTKEGATKGTMKFYQGSELYIDWFVQHGCGVGHPNLRCQITLQYMTDSDNPNLRDGTDQDSAGGDDEDPTEEATAEVARGYHEPLEYYQACYERERNKGLFTSDQQIEENGGATSTRQNPNGNGRRRGNQRHGLECPEERDYYPYWHPTPWHDIAIFTNEPQERCEYYRAESQNVKEKGRCSINQYNNPDACTGNGGEWTLEPAFNEPPPECWGGIASRDNHNGNVRNGHPDYYLWKIPEHIKGRVVLRIRYNITTDDFTLGSLANPTEEGTSLSGIKADPFFMDRSFNDPNPNNRRRSTFTGRPAVPVYGRTFEDRTHTFLVIERPADVPADRRIVNYNVRGRRGNIVQVYPSVEYDFVPQDLVVEQGTLLHFQWTGSDANNNGNAGNGRAGTDRSNLVQAQHVVALLQALRDSCQAQYLVGPLYPRARFEIPSPRRVIRVVRTVSV